jgi:hypothetical protein
LLVSTPSHGPLRRLWLGLSARAFERNFDPRSDHVRFFTANSLRTLLTDACFEAPTLVRHRPVLLASARRLEELLHT